jgi:hypothetical protein
MMRCLSALACLLALFAPPAGGATNYVDASSGDDGRDGLSPAGAWRSLDRVNGRTFEAGDVILFRAGTRYEGHLEPKGSGRVEGGRVVPIVVDMYGDGPMPRIDGGGKFAEAVLLKDVEFWEVRHLEVTNTGPERAGWRAGVRVVSDQGRAVRHVRLSGLVVHDVNGDLRKSREGCGIYFESRGRSSHFEGLVVERCHVYRTDRNGICQRGALGARSTGVVVRENLLEDIGGDGIKVWGSDDALIERNVLRGGRQRCEDAAAGIWPFDSDRTVIQYNEVSGMKGTNDGQAFDADFRCRGTTIQYNYSHDNDGGFLLVCAPGRAYCEGTVVRYNVSQNDGVGGARVIQIGGGPRNTHIYNNTIYVGPRQDLPLVSFNEWNGAWAEGTRFSNNVFYVDGRARYRLGQSRGTSFDHNIYFGPHDGRPADEAAVLDRPALVAPGTGAAGFGSLGGYRWAAGARPVVGTALPDAGARHDFFGTPISASQPVCVGVHQVP